MWNNTWNLTPDLDLKRFPSSGPYKLESVSKDGAVVLVANDKWWGAKPVTNKITVSPRGADVQDRLNNGSVDVVDVATGSSGVLNMPEDYTQTDTPSAGIEQLIFSAQGPMAAPPARRALALCTPRDVIARNAEVPIANTRLNPVTEEAVGSVEAVGAEQFIAANPDAARARWAISHWRCASAIKPPTRGWPRPSARSPSPARLPASPCRTSPPKPPAR